MVKFQVCSTFINVWQIFSHILHSMSTNWNFYKNCYKWNPSQNKSVFWIFDAQFKEFRNRSILSSYSFTSMNRIVNALSVPSWRICVEIREKNDAKNKLRHTEKERETKREICNIFQFIFTEIALISVGCWIQWWKRPYISVVVFLFLTFVHHSLLRSFTHMLQFNTRI